MSIQIDTIRLFPRQERNIFYYNSLPGTTCRTWKFCIESIRKNSSLKNQIIVHVNEGKDGTLDWLKDQADVDYTHSAKNVGICYALNYCRQLMATDYLLYINDDMYVAPGWDKHLYDEIQAIGHKSFFLSATQFEPESENPCCICVNYGTSLETFREADFLKEFDSYEKKDWQGSSWPPNVVHKDNWDLVGGYSVEFSPGMSSDPDFSMKLWKLGIRIHKGISKSRVYHFAGKSTGRIKKNDGYYMFINKLGMSTRIFQRNYLRLGEIYQGPAPEAPTSFKLSARNLYKRLSAAFKRKV